MSDFFEFIIDLGKFLFMVLAGFIAFLLVVVIISEMETRQDKKECYEIYATDNVILKKCEKYFEEE